MAHAAHVHVNEIGTGVVTDAAAAQAVLTGNWGPDMNLLIKAGIPAGVVHKIEETASSQNVRDRNLISEVRSETGPVQIVGSGFKMGQESRTIQASVPALGEHTTEVLQSLKQERQ